MKLNALILCAVWFWIGTSQVLAQDIEYKFFQKGNTYFSINQQVSWGLFNQQFNDQDVGDLSQFNSNLNWNRALTDNVGVGATDQAQRGVFENDDFRGVNTQFEFGVGGAYAFDLGDRQLVANAGVAFGQVKDVSESGSTEFETKDDLFAIRGKVGMPVQLYDSELHLVPFVGYEYNKTSGDENDFNENKAVFGLDLYSSVPCNGWWFNQGYEPNKQFRYTSGTQMWGNGTWLNGYFGTESVESGGFDFDTNVAGVDLGVNYSYYIQERLAVGVRASLGWDRSSPKDSDTKSSFTDLSLAPLIRWHPLDSESCADYYVEGSGGFVTSKSTIESGGSSSDNKLNGFAASIGVGKFMYLNEFLSLNPMVSYNLLSTKDPDSSDDLKLETKGLQVSVGLNYSF